MRALTSVGNLLRVSLAFMMAAPASAQLREVNTATINQWMQELSNAKRWGADDELGALNLITPAKRRAAIALVRDGYSVSLSRPYTRDDKNDDSFAFRHQMLSAGPGPFASDRYSFSYHGALHTHLDALCHMGHEQKMYNGIGREHVSEKGCARLSIANLRDGIITRAVLFDIPRLKGLDALKPGTPIYVEDLEVWEKKTGIKVQAGDLLLVRTGRWAPTASPPTAQTGAGLHASTAPWLKSRDIAVIGSDYATDVVPSGVAGTILPLHQLLLVAMGVHILDNLDLERVAAEAAQRKRWDFLVVTAPLVVAGGTGSPVNVIAMF